MTESLDASVFASLGQGGSAIAILCDWGPLSLWAYKIPGLVFAFCFGACVGSFINVVAYRLPRQMSIISPPSRCPTCGARLTWKENFPILGWLVLRGRCRYCAARISPHYMLVELFMAFVFLGLAVVFYVVPPAASWWGEIAGPWWYHNGFLRTWPAFIAVLVMYSGLVAMTLIDARTFTIPIQIPAIVIAVAWIGHLVQGLLPATQKIWPNTGGMVQEYAIPLVHWPCLLAGFGGVLGIAVGLYFLWTGRLRYSFADYGEYMKDDEPIADYPHARREMLVELLFLGPAIVLTVAGFLVGKWMSPVDPPHFVATLGSSVFGYLFAGGLLWGARIFFTLVFGREALGLGDVHLMAAVGAAIGWRDPIFIFFGGAIVGLAWWIGTLPVKFFKKDFRRELPYGPHLAAATLLVLLLHPVLYHGPNWWGMISTVWQTIFPSFC